jgi:hypothetical protein
MWPWLMPTKTPALENAVLDWLRRVSTAEKPPQSVVAYNIGILETEEGYSAYLEGADLYDPDDDDWACDGTFTPKERYVALPIGGAKATWELVLERVAAAVRTYLASTEGRGSFLATATAVTVGFDGGDLRRVK